MSTSDLTRLCHHPTQQQHSCQRMADGSHLLSYMCSVTRVQNSFHTYPERIAAGGEIFLVKLVLFTMACWLSSHHLSTAGTSRLFFKVVVYVYATPPPFFLRLLNQAWTRKKSHFRFLNSSRANPKVKLGSWCRSYRMLCNGTVYWYY